MADDKPMDILKPGEIIKPVLPDSAVEDFVLKLYGFHVKHWKELNSYHDKNYHVFLNTVESDGPCIARVSPDGYVLKVLNSLESKNPALTEAQHSLMEFLREKGIKTQRIIRNKSGSTFSVETVDNNKYDDSRSYIVRLLSYIPGEIFHLMPYVPKTFYNAGKFAAAMHNAMKDFQHEMFESFSTVWSLEEIDRLTDFMFVIKDSADHHLISSVIQSFKDNVQPKYDMFTRGIIHGDISEQNLILAELPNQDSLPREQRASEIRGILDFAHANKSYHIY
ncbi:hypothetical protein FSP39_024877 [Pinctada imbricata]|uniref:Hydroxylysine kinase n=1 Tax=Pinctada imbricata TaxID=66713 RepID=A0AA89C652_PINIB|nr:hypothetical protein FSP39_024877 [Pinctada imbricata]